MFHTSFDNKGREVCCKVLLYKNCQWQSCSAIDCLSSGVNILAGGSSIPLISECKGTDPYWKHVRCTHFASQRGSCERYQKSLITANMQSKTGFPSSHQLKSYVALKSRLKLAVCAVLSADAGLLVVLCCYFFLFLFPCGKSSWLSVSFSAHTKVLV